MSSPFLRRGHALYYFASSVVCLERQTWFVILTQPPYSQPLYMNIEELIVAFSRKKTLKYANRLLSRAFMDDLLPHFVQTPRIDVEPQLNITDFPTECTQNPTFCSTRFAKFKFTHRLNPSCANRFFCQFRLEHKSRICGNQKCFETRGRRRSSLAANQGRAAT
jgi:hypothetical protein